MNENRGSVAGWRIKASGYRLQGEICGDCDEIIFPPRDICPRCGSYDTSTTIEYGQGVPENEDDTSVAEPVKLRQD